MRARRTIQDKTKIVVEGSEAYKDLGPGDVRSRGAPDLARCARDILSHRNVVHVTS